MFATFLLILFALCSFGPLVFGSAYTILTPRLPATSTGIHKRSPFSDFRSQSQQSRQQSLTLLVSSRRGQAQQGDRWNSENEGVLARIESFFLDLSMTKALLIANAIMYLVTKGVPGLSYGNQRLLNQMTKVNWLVSRGQVHRLATSLFLHGNMQHLLFNSLSLSSIGPEAERMFGSERFLATYLAAGTLANYATFITGSSPVSLGASGCIFGIIGAFTTHFIRNRRILGRRADQGLESIKRTMLLNFLYTGMQPGIDHAAHAYGFIGGAVFSYIFGPRLFFRDGGVGYNKRVVDRPLFNYIPIWRSLKSSLVEGNDNQQRDGRFNPRRGTMPT